MKYFSRTPTYMVEIPPLLDTQAIYLITARSDGKTGSVLARLTAIKAEKGTALSVFIPHSLNAGSGLQRLSTNLGFLTQAGVNAAQSHNHDQQICSQACAVLIELRGNELQFLHCDDPGEATGNRRAS